MSRWSPLLSSTVGQVLFGEWLRFTWQEGDLGGMGLHLQVAVCNGYNLWYRTTANNDDIDQAETE